MTDEQARRGRNNRRKGHDFERAVAATLRDLGVAARRTLQSRGGGKEGADVQVEGYHVECKTGACPNLWDAMRQSRRDAEDTGRVPIVIAHRKSSRPFTAAEEVMVLPLSVGLQLIAGDIKLLRAEMAGQVLPVVGPEDDVPVPF